ncbi:NUDIX hydrolase [Haloprofundus salilacus]|uniref:NUDIX hydrolase n=1 Tax=Haloprofundus salilacus TaxID=2876190 RepID=UPI001CD004F7|nr:NUDIX domain-containing protein [Haloprofundus salilacus]
MTEEPLRATVSLRGVLFGPESEVLVVRRASDGGWELPGGRLGSGEPVVLGLRREIEEETSLDPDVEEPVHTFAWQNDEGRGRFAVYYYCTVDGKSVSLSAEHTDYDWVAVETATERLSDTQTEAVVCAWEIHGQ